MTRYYVCGDALDDPGNLTQHRGTCSTKLSTKSALPLPLYEIELNTAESQVTETVIYGNIQLRETYR